MAQTPQELQIVEALEAAAVAHDIDIVDVEVAKPYVVRHAVVGALHLDAGAASQTFRPCVDDFKAADGEIVRIQHANGISRFVVTLDDGGAARTVRSHYDALVGSALACNLQLTLKNLTATEQQAVARLQFQVAGPAESLPG